MKVCVWDNETIDRLQGCFEATDWNILYSEESDIDTNTDVITEYIKFCVEKEVETKEVKCFANNKPWVTKDLKELLNEKKVAVASKDKEKLKEVQRKVKRKIWESKVEYKNKLEIQFSNRDSRNAWKGLKTLTGFNMKKSCLPDVPDNKKFADELNEFYARFDQLDFTEERKVLIEELVNKNDDNISITETETRKDLSKINPRKSNGPDGLPGKVLKECSQQLSHIVTRLLYIPLFSRGLIYANLYFGLIREF